MVLLLLMALGCRAVDAEPTESDVESEVEDTEAEDTAVEDTGEVEQSPVEEIFAGLDPCEEPEGDGALDLLSGCADGGCGGDTYGELEAAWGTPSCYEVYYEIDTYTFQYRSCDYPNGLNASFDGDGAGTYSDDDPSDSSLSVDLPYEGRTLDGAGLDAEFACFMSELGDPGSFDLDEQEGDWVVGMMSWQLIEAGSYIYIYAYDSYDNKTYDYESDGLVDAINVYVY